MGTTRGNLHGLPSLISHSVGFRLNKLIPLGPEFIRHDVTQVLKILQPFLQCFVRRRRIYCALALVNHPGGLISGRPS
jgi:hypothetical protein